MYQANNTFLQKDQAGVSRLIVTSYLTLGLMFIAVWMYIQMTVKHVTVITEKQTISYNTFAPKVRDVLKEVGIKGNIGPTMDPRKLQEGQSISFLTLSEDSSKDVTDGMKIRVYNDRFVKTVEAQAIAAPVRREWDIFMEPGNVRVVKPGKKGLLNNVFLTGYRDGKVVSRQKTASRLIEKPSPLVLACGSYEVVARQSRASGTRAVKFTATAYSYTGNRTAVGARTRRGIVAVDPRVIPLGSKLYIEGYGYGVAADTGGAIKGRKLDLFFENRNDAINWGRRNVNVHFLQ